MVPLIAAAAVAAASSLAGAYIGGEASKDAARMAAEQEQKGPAFFFGNFEESGCLVAGSVASLTPFSVLLARCILILGVPGFFCCCGACNLALAASLGVHRRVLGWLLGCAR